MVSEKVGSYSASSGPRSLLAGWEGQRLRSLIGRLVGSGREPSPLLRVFIDGGEDVGSTHCRGDLGAEVADRLAQALGPVLAAFETTFGPSCRLGGY